MDFPGRAVFAGMQIVALVILTHFLSLTSRAEHMVNGKKVTIKSRNELYVQIWQTVLYSTLLYLDQRKLISTQMDRFWYMV
jgi:hypothetical protein